MTALNAAQVDKMLALLGTDIALDFPGPSGYWEDADLAVAATSGRLPATVDLATASRLAAADQMIVNRLKTQKGELSPLGHPEYGSRHHQLIGQPNVGRTRNLIKLYVLEALSHEARIEKVLQCTVSPDHDPPRDMVRIVIDVRLRGDTVALNLVVPFNLGVN